MQAGHQKTEQIRQAINCEDYKRAIKLASKIADKSELAKAMQAYALERLGRRDEALEICEALLGGTSGNNSGSGTKDERVFVWLTHVLAMAKQYKEIAKLQLRHFEQTPPKPVDRYCMVGSAYFEALCKTFDFNEASVQALRLAKINDPNLNLTSIWLWASTLAFLKAPIDCTSDDTNVQMSEAFFNKAAASSKSGATKINGLPLRRWILIRRGKVKETLDTLAFLPDESPAARLWTRSLVLRLLGDEVNREEEFKVLQSLVQHAESNDDFRAFARLGRIASSSKEKSDLLQSCITSIVSANPKLRGPMMATVRFEVEKFLQSTTDGNSISTAVIDYLKSKATLPASFFDLQNDLQVFAPPLASSTATPSTPLPGDLLPALVQICPLLIPTKTHVDLDRQSRRWPIESCPWRVSHSCRSAFLKQVLELAEENKSIPVYHQVLRSCGYHESLAGIGECDKLVKQYIDQGLLQALDVSARDDWILLASQMLMDTAMMAGNGATTTSRLVLAASLLHYQIGLSPDNFQLKLALNDLYGHRLGCAKPAFEIFKLLRVKQIQLDALGFIALADLSACGFFQEAEEYARSISEFNSRARGETADCFAEAFRYVEQSSPIEVVRLENRLRDSYQNASSVVERCMNSMLPPLEQQSNTKKAAAQAASTTSSSQQGEDDVERKKTNLFAKLKVEVEDPARGESQVCLPELRLASVLKRRDEISNKFCVNSDFEVQACFDPPYSRNFQHELKTVLPRSGPCARVPREAQNSKEFLALWKQRMDDWMALRLLGLEALIRPLNENRLIDMNRLIESLGLTTLNENEWAKKLWTIAPKFLEVLASGKLSEEIVNDLSAIDAALTLSTEQMVSMSGSMPRQFLSDVSTVLSHAGLWTFAVIGRLNHAHKKQTKAKPFPFDSTLFVKIRDLVAKMFQKLAQIMERARQQVEKQQGDLVPSIRTLAKQLGVGVTFEPAFVEVSTLVCESHLESFRRLRELSTVFATFELYQT